MKKTLLILAAILVVLGLVLTAAALFATDFTFDFLQSGTIQNTHEITQDFQNISIHVDTADVRFLPSGDGTCKVVFTETEKLRHVAAVEHDTLYIGLQDSRHWYEQMFTPGNLSAEIYLPQSRYVSLEFESDTGDLHMPGAFLFSMADIETDTADVDWQADLSGKISVSVDTGDILLMGLSAGSLELDCDTGDVKIVNTVALKTIEIEADTGDVFFDRADAESIRVETDTGDVTGTFLTEKLFRAESDTGRVEVPWDTRGGDCIVISDTGDIRLSIAE